MATGGVPASDPDHTECSVCLESMDTKDPRLLTCGHPFCSPCIQKLAANDSITCPICREETKLPNGVVEKLPKYDLIKESSRNCGVCLRHNKQVKVTHKCDQCPVKMICGSCADMHSLLPPLMSHKIKIIKVDESQKADICQVHTQPLDYYCSECQIALCFHCMFIKEHKGHENKITDIEQGVSGLKKVIAGINQELLQSDRILKWNIRCINLEINTMKTSKKELVSLRKLLQHHMTLTVESTQILSEHQQELENQMLTLKEMKRESESLQKDFLGTDEFSKHAYLKEAKEYISKAKSVLKDLQKPVDGFTTAKYIPGDLCGAVGNLQFRFHPAKQFSSEELSLKNPELIKHLKAEGILQLQYPREILSVGDETVILVDEGFNDLQRIDIEGNIVQVYNMEKAIKSAAIERDTLFIACQDKTITIININQSKPRVTYKADVDNIGRVTARGMKVYVSNWTRNGKIYECDNEQTNVCLSDLDNPWYLNCADVNGEPLFIVTEYGKRRINIYDSSWKLVLSIDTRLGSTLKNPRGSVITPGGKVLVADYETSVISEFNMDGIFIRDILKSPAINNPNGILYDSPWLWVTEATPALKLFKVE